jgi:DNA primase catalytic subunit
MKGFFIYLKQNRIHNISLYKSKDFKKYLSSNAPIRRVYKSTYRKSKPRR